MKIHLRGRPKQYGFIKVTCLDSLMVEMLSCVPDAPPNNLMVLVPELRAARDLRYIHRFCCGAALKLGDAPNEFFVQSLNPDGSDGLAAIEELKMLDALRIAKKHFKAMKKVCYNPTLDNIGLRVTQY